MKKILTLAFAIGVISFSANSQNLTSKRGENFLPEKGDWSIGFNADGIFEYVGNAFNNTANNVAPSVDYVYNGMFVGKKFTSDKKALRFIANLGVGNDKVGDNSSSKFDVALGLGKEYRKGKTRLQGFYGADVMAMVATASTKTETKDYQGNAGLTKTLKHKNGLGLGIGAQGFMGAEYFIFPKIAVGAQYTYGLSALISGKSKDETSYSGTGAGTGLFVNTSVDGVSSTGLHLGGVGVASMSINVYF